MPSGFVSFQRHALSDSICVLRQFGDTRIDVLHAHKLDLALHPLGKFCRVFGARHEYTLVSQPRTLPHALLELRHGSHFATEPHLSDRSGSGGEGPFVLSAGDREQQREITRGLGHLQSANTTREDIAVCKPQARVLLQHSDEHGKAVGIEPAALALCCTKKTRRGECL